MIEPGRSPRLTDDVVRLWPVTPDDHQFLYWIATSDLNQYRWRYRNQIPPYDVFVAHLHQDVLAQFVVRSAATNDPVGLVVAYAADLRSGHCFVGAVMREEEVGGGLGLRSLVLLIDYLFGTWPFHKVFAEVPEFTNEAFALKGHSLGDGPGAFKIEGRFEDYLFLNGRYWDMLIVGVEASAWRERDEDLHSQPVTLLHREQ